MSYSQQHINEAVEILQKLDVAAIEAMALILADIKQKQGRLFFLGVGGSAGNCSHAVNDFRNLFSNYRDRDIPYNRSFLSYFLNFDRYYGFDNPPEKY